MNCTGVAVPFRTVMTRNNVLGGEQEANDMALGNARALRADWLALEPCSPMYIAVHPNGDSHGALRRLAMLTIDIRSAHNPQKTALGIYSLAAVSSETKPSPRSLECLGLVAAGNTPIVGSKPCAM